MGEILLINPRKKRKTKNKTVKKEVEKMVKRKYRKRTQKKMAVAPRKRRIRRNPSNPKESYRRAAKNILGMDIKSALKSIPAFQVGMFAAKFSAKLWGTEATETDPETWNWASYAKGALGTVAVAALASQYKSGIGRNILLGGLNLIAYKAIQNELVAKNETATKWLGADEDYIPEEYIGALEPGTVIDDSGLPVMMGENGIRYPVDDSHRLPDYSMMGTTLEPVGPLGTTLEPVGPLGDDPYARLYQ